MKWKNNWENKVIVSQGKNVGFIKFKAFTQEEG